VQTEENKFSFNPQVAIMLLITGAAMMIPLALVIVAVHSYLNPKPKVTEAEPNTEVLRQALEKTSQTVLEEPRTETATLRVERVVEDPAAEGAKIEALSKEFGGFAMETATARWLIQVPDAKRAEFLKAADPDGKTDPAGNQLIEITLTKKKP
jgi:hypothetical protein